MKLSNPMMERIFLKIRSRVGSILVPAAQIKSGLEPWKARPYLLMLGADQSVGNPASAWWMNFLNRPATFPAGPGRNAVKENLPVLYTWLEKMKRGRYILHTRMLCENPAAVGPEGLTRLFCKQLEQTITAAPDNYLWSHKRWKHKWKPEYAANWIGDSPVPNPQIEEAIS
jgi:KDO2-lipid IV(A) lauroyltransferase